MRGQANLIATTIMVGVTLVIGIATLAYFNTYMAQQTETINVQKAVYDASSSLVISLVARENDTAIFFVTSRSTLYYGIAIAGVKEPLHFVYLAPGTDYQVYEASAVDVDAVGTQGWRRLNVTITSGKNVVYDISTFANLPVPVGLVKLGISEPNRPVTIRLDLSLTKQVDLVRVYVLALVNQKWFAINYYDLPVAG